MRALILFIAVVLLFTNCKKMAEAIIDGNPDTITGQFTKFTIRSGEHYCDVSGYKSIETAEMKFVVKFDSSAIYRTQSAENQYDINKLYGFSDNNKDHHQFSARFGWRWSDDALRLFAYVYNDGMVTSKELTSIAIGSEVSCSIKVAGTLYLFTINDTEYEMPRMSSGEKAKGYQLYPYFGGDEVAPHQIRIWIKTL